MYEENRAFKDHWKDLEDDIQEVQTERADILKKQLESWYKAGWIAAEVCCEFKRDEIHAEVLRKTQEDVKHWQDKYSALQQMILKIGRESEDLSREG